MRARTDWLSRSSPLGPPWFDVLLAAVLALYGQVNVWTELTNERVPGPEAIGSLGLLLATAPLAWRRTRPLLVTCVVMVAIAAEAIAAGEAPVGGAILFPVLVALYSVAAYARLRPAVTGLAVAWIAVLVHGAYDPAVLSFGEFVLVDVFFFWFLGGGSWFAGRYVRSRRHEVSTFERRRAASAHRAALEERARIARELHDVIAHGVSVMGVQAAAAEQMLDADPERAREPLRAIQGAAREAITELRALLGVLREPEDEPSRVPQPRLAELDALVEQVRAGGLEVELLREGPAGPLPAGIELSAYRIVQEALTNTLKHGGPGRARVCVRRGSDELEIEVVDEGVASAAEAGNGHGLVGMRERVALYGGTLEAGPREDGGYAVRARLPVGEGRVIRVVIADDQDLVREGLSMILGAHDDIQVVGQAGDGRQAVETARLVRPDVVLMDIRMPGLDGIDATRRLLERDGAPRVLMLTTFDLDEYVYEALKAGASGFMLKNAPPDRLAEAVRTVAAGDALLAPAITRRVIEAFVRGPLSGAGPAPELAELTEREVDVLRRIARGLSNAEIAQDLVVSEATVKTHVNRVLTKLGLRDRTQAAVLAYELGLVVPGVA